MKSLAKEAHRSAFSSQLKKTESDARLQRSARDGRFLFDIGENRNIRKVYNMF